VCALVLTLVAMGCSFGSASGTHDALHQGMWKFLSFLPFLRRRSRFGRFGELAGRVGPRRGGFALGGLLSLALPFVIRKLMARRADRPAQPAF
jgi:hypothetical protein